MTQAHATEPAWRSVVDASADGMVVVNEYGIICYANPAAVVLFGRDEAELVGRFFGFPVEAGEATEIGIFCDGQPLTVEMRVTGIEWDGEDAYLAALRDITDRKQAEEALRSAIELRDDVIGVVGHDLRTPISIIVAAARILLDEADGISDPEHREILSRIRRQAWQLDRVVESLLTLSRIEGDQLEVDRRPTSVRAVVEAVVEDLRQAGLEVPAEIDVAESVEASADESHMRLILTNYLTNAIKYGGPPIEVAAHTRGGTVEIVVSDHGDGVPDEFRPHLFERFRRAEMSDAQVEGSGLGLTVARRLAEAGDGEVDYEPNQPSGACFYVRLPSP